VPELTDSAASRPDTGFIVVRACRQGYAIPIAHVREVASLPQVARIPNSPPSVRGVINFRGEVLPVIDLRVLLDQATRRQEIDGLVQLLNDREQDHHNWIADLEASVREDRPFKLARDPHQCKFGKWYDTYHPDHASLAFIWSSLDRPHKAIHALADQVLSLTTKGDARGGLALITDARETDLRLLVDRLTEARRGLLADTRELGVILDWEGGKIALGVDSAEAVEDLTGVEFVPLPDTLPPATRRLVTAVMRLPGNEELVLCLDSDQLIARNSVVDGADRAAA
jgi:chemotaxis signal transduction protein